METTIKKYQIQKEVHKTNEPFVAVWMVTYNQEKFITAAIEGVIMQEANFSFKLFIGEDCSTDSTRQICLAFQKKYPDKIELLFTEVNSMKQNSRNIFTKCFQSSAKYIAMCEGDDYWTDPHKLQKQVDFLEANEKIVGCFSDAMVINNDGQILQDAISEENKKEVAITQIGSFWMPTLTICLRNIYLESIINSSQFSKVNNGDMFLYYTLSQFGNFAFVKTIPSCYRMHLGGVWSGLKVINQYEKNQVSNYIIYDELLPKFKNIVVHRIKENYTWQLNYLRDIEHITYVFKILGNNLYELFKRKLFKEAFTLLMMTFPVLVHRIKLRVKRIFQD